MRARDFNDICPDSVQNKIPSPTSSDSKTFSGVIYLRKKNFFFGPEGSQNDGTRKLHGGGDAACWKQSEENKSCRAPSPPPRL